MDNEFNLIYEELKTVSNDIKSMKKDINATIEELNIKIATLQTQMDIVLDNRKNYNELNNKVQVMNNQLNELNDIKDSNRSLYQSIIVGIIVFVATYLIRFIQ